MTSRKLVFEFFASTFEILGLEVCGDVYVDGRLKLPERTSVDLRARQFW